MEMDRLKASFQRLVLSLVARTDYHALYPSVVVAQNADKTLELQPDAARMPPLSKVPIRVGIPGVVVQLAAGARVLLGFENGDPNRPYAGLWDTATLVELVINGGAVGLAKADHTHTISNWATVTGATLAGTATTGTPSSNTSLVKVP